MQLICGCVSFDLLTTAIIADIQKKEGFEKSILVKGFFDFFP